MLVFISVPKRLEHCIHKGYAIILKTTSQKSTPGVTTWDVQIKFSAFKNYISLTKRKFWWFICVVYFYNINKRLFLYAMCFHSISCMALQPLLGSGLPRKTLPFFSVFCSSPPSSCSQDLPPVPPDDVLPSCSWFSHLSCIMKFPIKNLSWGAGFFHLPFLWCDQC